MFPFNVNLTYFLDVNEEELLLGNIKNKYLGN